MGLDIYGKRPTADVGQRYGQWDWFVMWELACEVCPHAQTMTMRGFSGDGLAMLDVAFAEDAQTLADEIRSAVQRYDVHRFFFKGVADGKWWVRGQYARFRVENPECCEALGEQHVAFLRCVDQFEAFLRGSGGFQIT